MDMTSRIVLGESVTRTEKRPYGTFKVTEEMYRMTRPHPTDASSQESREIRSYYSSPVTK